MKQHPPLKWLKYLLLTQYELTTSNRLRREVRRFTWKHRWDLISHLSDRFDAAKSDRQALLIVVKFVETEAVGALPNYRLNDASRLPGLKDLFDRPQSKYAEVWSCETRVDPDRLSVAGRILFQDSQPEVAQHVEQVWRASPRMIEELAFGAGKTTLPFPYVRAYRPAWSWQFRIAEIHRPDNLHSSASDIEREFRWTMDLLERQRQRVERFIEMLHAAGASAVALEYKAEDDTLWFIDWDTAIDQQILTRVFK